MLHREKGGSGGRRQKKKRRTRRPAARWLRNKELASYFGVSVMTLWRWKNNPALGFPAAAIINGIEHNDRLECDGWMKKRRRAPAGQPVAGKLEVSAA
jgi:hypothetical protein